MFAQALTLTEAQTEGPFYPPDLPLDTDNDLLIVNDAITPAVGEITHLSGRILDATGAPIHNTLVEIWQVDGNGVYLHPEHSGPSDGNLRARQDKNFQGFGRFMTGSTGEYYFRTVKPVPYPDSEGVYRHPHIHFAIKMKGREKWTTQAYSKDESKNESGRPFRSIIRPFTNIADPKARESVMLDFVPVRGSRIGELAARFDIVLGFTPEA